MKGDHGPTKKLQDLTWVVFDHAPYAPHLTIICRTYADTILILRSSEQVEQLGLVGDGPGLQDLSQPKGILMVKMLGREKEDISVEETHIPLVYWK